MSPKDTKRSSAVNQKSIGWTDGEKAAMKARAQELKAEARASKNKAEGERAVLAAISKMPAPYRDIGKRLHAIIKDSVPNLAPKTWYGLPAYANSDGKIVCYLRMNPKPPYNDRYLTFGFNETANLDEGGMWPVAFALTKLTATEEAKVSALVMKATT